VQVFSSQVADSGVGAEKNGERTPPGATSPDLLGKKLHVGLTILNFKIFSEYFREGSMPATFSYASILHAVGQVLDQLGVKSIAIQEEEDGLFVEGFDGDGQLQVQMRYDIAGLYDLVSRAGNQLEEQQTIHSTGVLRRFLADHNRELVTVSL
jgi:hypothetical protein